jgi:hypothetical protein
LASDGGWAACWTASEFQTESHALPIKAFPFTNRLDSNGFDSGERRVRVALFINDELTMWLSTRNAGTPTDPAPS